MPRILAAAVALCVSCSLAIPADAATLRPRSGAYELQVLVGGQPVRSFSKDGNTWLLGQLGARYTLRVLNRSGRPIEAVVSVDGRDVIDGDTAAPQKGGYLVPAYGQVDIDGWRISAAQAAAFRFSSVSESYAARVGSGREVGVIGVAVYEKKREPPPPILPPVSPYPTQPSYPYSCCSGGQSSDDKPAMQQNQAGGVAADAEASRAQPSDSVHAAPPAPAGPPRSMSMDSMEKSRASMGAVGGGVAQGDAQASAAPRKKERAGLGTEYGESVNSPIYTVQFERATTQPRCYLGVHYNDREGLIAMGIDVDGVTEQALRETANPFPVNERFAPPPPGWSR